MKKEYFLLLILIFLIIILAIVCFGSSFEDKFKVEFGEDPVSATENLQQQPTTLEPGPNAAPSGNSINPVTEGTTIIPAPTSPTAATANGGIISGITGSHGLLLYGGALLGGFVISSIDNNQVPSLNPLTGDVIVYTMNAGDTVLIDYTQEPAYRATMSEGVEAELLTQNRIRFIAYSDDSVLKVIPTEDPSYQFNDGRLEYENDNVLEKINTTKEDEANVDANYDTGFKCLTLAGGANYDYEDKIEKTNSFSLKNINKQDFNICVKKTVYDEYKMTSQRYGLIDLVKDSIKIKSKILYQREGQNVFESLDERNEANIETNLGTTKLTIQNRVPTAEIVANTYIGNHILTENTEGNQVIRYHQFSQEKYPDMINIYSTTFKTQQPEI
ncbi:MAG: hypothetical protein L6408_00220 [Nanoarchaeota archaeon]|nr:hypothetical protein [Nanoarchaeota archaeon]